VILLARAERVDHKTIALLLVSVPLICYAIAAGVYFFGLSRVGLGLTFFGYSVANVGLIMDLYGK
jgi:hypothetical protein